MRNIFTKNHKITLYESIMDLPAHRDNLMNYFLLEDSGLGSTMQDIDNHLSSLYRAIESGKPNDVAQAITNLRNTCYANIVQYRADHLAWCALIHSVDGEPIEDSVDAMKKLVDKLSRDGLKEETISFTLDEIKKKLPTSWEYTSLHGQE